MGGVGEEGKEGEENEEGKEGEENEEGEEGEENEEGEEGEVGGYRWSYLRQAPNTRRQARVLA